LGVVFSSSSSLKKEEEEEEEEEEKEEEEEEGERNLGGRSKRKILAGCLSPLVARPRSCNISKMVNGTSATRRYERTGKSQA